MNDYDAGVWGFSALQLADQVQAKALRVFLGLHNQVPLAKLKGDIGWIKPPCRRWSERLPLWNRLIALPQDHLTYKIFTLDYEHAKSGLFACS